MRDILNKYVTGAALLVGLALVPGSAFAQVGAQETDELDEVVEDELDEEGEEDEKAWSVSATLLTRVYQGMFAELENQDPDLSSPNASDPADAFDRWMNIYVLSGGYTLSDFSFSADVFWTHWMTPGGDSNGPYKLRFQDPELSASWSGYTFESIDTTVSARYALGLPASKISQAAGLVVSNSLSANVSRTFFDKLSLKYSLGGSWMPHSEPDQVLPENIVDVYRPNEAIGSDVRVGGLNTQFGLTNALSASIPVWDKLSASASYSLTKYWTYHQDNDDENTSPHATIGRGTADMTLASVALSYPLGDYVNLSGGIRTQQTPKTADNSSFRFPFWSFSGRNAAAGNRSAVQLSVSGSY